LTKRQQAEELSKRLQETERDIVSLSAQAGQQERQVRQLREVLGQKEKILADYERYQDLQEQAEEFTQSLARLNALRSQQSALQLAIERERAKVAQERARLQSQYAAEKRNIEEAESTLQKAAEIEAGYERLQAARQEDKGWEQRRAQHETLENQRREVERQIEKARNEIQVQVNTLTRQAQELKRKADALPARKEELEKAQAAVESLGELSARRSAAQEEFQQHTAELAALKAQKEAAEREMTALQQRLEVVRSNKDPQCPVCRQPLDERHQKEIERQIAQESENAKKSVQAVLNQGRLVRGKKDELDKRIKEWDERLKGQSAAERRMAQAQTAVEEAARALEDLKKVTEEVRALNERLEKKDFAAEEHAKLTQVTATLKEVGYDAARHQATRRALSDWQRFEAERVRLEAAREQHRRVVENLPTLEAALQRVEAVLERKDYASEEQKKLIETENAMKSLYYDESAHRAAQVELRQLSDVSARKERLDSAEKSIGDMEETWQRQRQTLTEKEEQRQSWQQEQARWAEELTQLAPVEQRINAIAQAQRSGQQTRDGIVREQGEMEAKVRTVEKLAQEKVAEEERLKTLRHEQFIYEKLTVAFGRDGIPALIIENATPEIEDEANRLLSQLTDNRVQVSIEPLRDLKSGGIKETLDIKVSDELGTRPLELFSGGEAFRVDFALRIALSKLLAHRAGTRLRTLVVDEGFGTQDADGLQRMLEAINVISADFDKIVVITHLETLKNAFPARIEVVKLPDVGSKYEVVL
jgi:exonuclease SbcC